MAYDLEEQEQIDTLKAWWKQNGNLVTWLLILALGSYVAWNAWSIYQKGQADKASALYEEVQRAVTAKDNGKVQGAANAVLEKYSGSPYASFSALAAAKSAFDAADVKTAKTQLTWLVEHGYNDELKAVARLRLSGVLLDEKNFDEAVKLLGGSFPSSFNGDVLDRKADILVAQNKIDQARQTYKDALEKMGEKHAGRQLVQIKLDAIGGAPESTAAVSTEKK